MKISIYADGMGRPRELEVACLRVYNTMTEVYFEDPEAASDFYNSLEVDEYLLMAYISGRDVLDYTGEVNLNREAGIRIKSYPYTCVTFNLRNSVLDRGFLS